MARKISGERRLEQCAFKADPLVIEQVDQMAKAQGRNRSELVREALDRYLLAS